MGRLGPALGALALAAVGLAAGSPARAATPPATASLTLLAPLTATTATAVRAGDPTLYVAQQRGVVRAVDASGLVAAPVVDLTSLKAGRYVLELEVTAEGTIPVRASRVIVIAR